jgi:CheY-like chemotaxis protein
VLVAEDNTVNQRVIVQLLAKLGLTCEVAEDGRAALEGLGRRHYDLVLMDCQMPEMGGLTATRMIRLQEAEAGEGAHLPIFALTAGVTAQERAATLAAGMDEFLTKPIRKRELESALSRWLSPQVVNSDGPALRKQEPT